MSKKMNTTDKKITFWAKLISQKFLVDEQNLVKKSMDKLKDKLSCNSKLHTHDWLTKERSLLKMPIDFKDLLQTRSIWYFNVNFSFTRGVLSTLSLIMLAFPSGHFLFLLQTIIKFDLAVLRDILLIWNQLEIDNSFVFTSLISVVKLLNEAAGHRSFSFTT